MPAAIGSENDSANRRHAAVWNSRPAARDLMAIAVLPIATASTASASHTPSQAVGFAARAASPAAASAVAPMATCPQPGIAVSAEVRSIVWRM